MSSLLKQITNLVQVLETYRGHDRIIRLATYVAMFMGGDGSSPAGKKWKTVATEMSSCRVILRLFDDLPMLLMNLSTGFGLKGTKTVLKPLELLSAVLNQAFYPSEHIAWLRKNKIVGGMALPFLLLGLVIWAASLALEIVKSLIKLRLIASQRAKLIKQRQLDTDKNGQSTQNVQIRENLQKLVEEKKGEILVLLQCGSDLVNAISWMPPGFLWAQMLPSSANGVLGGISSLILLYRNWPATPVKGKSE